MFVKLWESACVAEGAQHLCASLFEAGTIQARTAR